MTIKVRAGGTTRTATSVKIKVAGVVRSVRSIRIMAGGSLRTIFANAPLTASADPDTVSGIKSGDDDKPGNATTLSTTVTVAGGVGPFTYAWTLISSDSGTPEADSPAFATTTFSQLLGPFETNSATFRCTATDSLGTTATADVTANFLIGGP